jgi:hypothetical protein
VTFTCEVVTPCTPGTPGCPGPPPPIPSITSCRLDRSAAGAFVLTIIGDTIRDTATVLIGGVAPKKLKFKNPEAGTPFFRQVIAKGRICGNIPGVIVIANPNTPPSNNFNCTERCPISQ